ncbi:hypothetical protein [Nonomuraea dietziae]|uniref:hypothetical protein n=1 Tax=Nonomuraea dietziae TaxID=65515 RepID=UPI0031DE13AC
MRESRASCCCWSFIWNFQHFDTIYVLVTRRRGPRAPPRPFPWPSTTPRQGLRPGHSHRLGGLWMLLAGSSSSAFYLRRETKESFMT